MKIHLKKGGETIRKQSARMYGFSCLEIMVVSAIVAILIGLFLSGHVPVTSLGDGELRTKKVRVRMKWIMKALEEYKVDNGNYPSTKQGLRALFEEPAVEPKPGKWRAYSDGIPLDPWRRAYIYICPGADAGKCESAYSRYELKSKGPDGIVGTSDDISSRNISLKDD